MSAAIQRNTVLLGDALKRLQGLPESSVDMVVTSPPYFLLRDYGRKGQVGLEGTVTEYVDRIVAVCDELARVLKPGGSLWLNLGDSYSRHDRYGAPAKSLLLAPERVLLALAARGYIVRNKIVWAKPNPMPTSVRDRLSCTYEPIYLLTRTGSYFFDLDAIRVPHKSRPRGLTPRSKSQRTESGPKNRPKYDSSRTGWAGPLAGRNDGLERARREGRAGHRLGKNPGDVWTLATAAYRGAHFATFPVALVTRPILAGCPARTCVACGLAWQQHRGRPIRAVCECDAGWQPGLVLDPFMGAGSTAVAARTVGRDWLGIELNSTYRDLALTRIASTAAPRAPDPEEMHNPQGASHGAP